jgi:hypothetical protein
MTTNRKTQNLTALALGLGLAAIVGPPAIAAHGLAHDIINLFSSLFILFVGAALALFATETASFGATPSTNSTTPDDKAPVPSLVAFQGIVLSVLRSFAIGINTIVSRQTLLMLKVLFFVINAVFALLSLVGVYQNANFATWSDCLLSFSIALCYGLSVILQMVAEATALPQDRRSSQSTKAPEALSPQVAAEKQTGLTKLLASQAFLWLGVVSFEAALKDGQFAHWWSFACFTLASLCLASFFFRGETA